ncbi:CamS family sex pheromone protein [Oceanobacillus iheyensis]|uniref:CamS family sex pheromone protein n=1 Tax=Oceanobacillus iheyensis TaxID=182710 RepID=UPI0036354B9D
MKKVSLLMLVLLLLLSGCLQNQNSEEEVVQDDAEQETSIVPSYQLSGENYRMILPYKTSAARGAIVNQMANRVDIDEMEEGLRRLSKDVYDPEELYFQEGQYFDTDRVYTWIDDLNPEVEEGSEVQEYRDNPRYLTHVLEQNFMRHTDDQSVELEGISLGIAMKSVYSFQTQTGGTTYYQDIPKDEMLSVANDVAQNIVKDIRENDENLRDVPIMIAIYREEEKASPVPGNFVARTNVPGGSSTIDDWEEVKEENILFPSDEGSEKYFEDQELVTNFGNEVREFFPNYVGLVGEGFYIDEELQKLQIEIPIEFNGKGEVIGFTQYAYGLVQEIFPNYYDIEINVVSSQKTESIIYRNAGEDQVNVHIYD